MINNYRKPAKNGSQGLMKGGLLAGGVHFGKKVMTRAVKHPVLIFGLGTLVGIYIFNKRNARLEASEQIQDQQPDDSAIKD